MVRQPPSNDADLVRRAARQNDHVAFGQLLRHHDPAMRRLASSMLSNPSLVDDALQDAYLNAFRAVGGFRGDSEFSTWLYRIVYRSCMEQQRRQRPTEPLDAVSTSLPSSHRFDESLVQSDLVRRALAQLSADHRAAVMLVDGSGYSYQETAEILQTTPGTVASRVSRAREALRAAYNRSNDREEETDQ